MTPDAATATTPATNSARPTKGLVDPVAQERGTTLITKHFDFEAAHFLPNVGDDHKCRRVHGHSYQVWVHVGGQMDPQAGWIVDFSDVKAIWKRLDSDLDHHLLNDVPGLANPTAENLAAWIWQHFERMRQQESSGVAVVAVEVAETADSRAMFVAPKVGPWVPGHPQVALPEQDVVNEIAPDSDEANHLQNPTAPARGNGRSQGLPDVQARPDDRGIAIDDVGVCGVRLPIELHDRGRGRQSTVGTVSMSVGLGAEVKGAHLSRFLQVVRDHPDGFTLLSLGGMTEALRDRLGSSHARVRVAFPYFVERTAPVSKESGLLDVDCQFEVIDDEGVLQHWMEVTAPVTTLCPCSRDISDYGAHNQRTLVTTRVRCADDEAHLPSIVWIEELIELAEASASAPVLPVCKRPDERHLTMTAFDNPRFVEDVVREVATHIVEDDRILDFEVRARSQESIHSHDAFAQLARSGM